jgi:hypothetical protein
MMKQLETFSFWGYKPFQVFTTFLIKNDGAGLKPTSYRDTKVI